MPPLPTPFPIPTPDPSQAIDVSAMWDVQNISGALSAFQTIWVLAQQNYLVTVFVVLGLMAFVVWWLGQFVGRRDENV